MNQRSGIAQSVDDLLRLRDVRIRPLKYVIHDIVRFASDCKLGKEDLTIQSKLHRSDSITQVDENFLFFGGEVVQIGAHMNERFHHSISLLIGDAQPTRSGWKFWICAC